MDNGSRAACCGQCGNSKAQHDLSFKSETETGNEIEDRKDVNRTKKEVRERNQETEDAILGHEKWRFQQ